MIYTSESIGDYSYTLNTTLNSTMTLPTHVADLCANYVQGRWAVMSIGKSLIDDAGLSSRRSRPKQTPTVQVPGQDPSRSC